MTTGSDPAPVHVSYGIYRILLYAYPSSFRWAYQGQMASLFRDDCRARYREGGRVGDSSGETQDALNRSFPQSPGASRT